MSATCQNRRRHEEKMHAIAWRDVEQWSRTGKVFRAPTYTVEGRPVLHMRPRYETTISDEAANLRHFAYQMEMITRHADDVSPDGKIVAIIDYTDFTIAKNPPLSTSRAVLRILQTHHPERLHEAILWHPPKLFSMLWKMVAPFVDNNTKEKMVFLEKKDAESPKQLQARMDVSPMDRTLGGKFEDSFNFEAYSVLMETEEVAYKQALSEFKRKHSIDTLKAATAAEGRSPQRGANTTAPVPT